MFSLATLVLIPAVALLLGARRFDSFPGAAQLFALLIIREFA